MEKLIDNKLTIYEVDALKESLLQVIEKQEEDLILDISSVEKIDMAAIQLLLSVQKSCKTKGFNLILSGIQNNIEESLKICACDVLIGGSS